MTGNQAGLPQGSTPAGSVPDPLGMGPEELAALQQIADPSQFTDPAMQQQVTAMNAKFTQTQQAMKNEIRKAQEWQQQKQEHDLVSREHTWMVNNPQIRTYLEGVQAGSINPSDPNGMGQANAQGQQAPAGGDQSADPWSNLPDPMVDPNAFGAKLQAGIDGMMGNSVQAAVASAVDQKLAPILRELVNRESVRSNGEQQAQFQQMESTYRDWQQVSEAVKADMVANPALGLAKAYRIHGDGMTHQEAARSGLTPASNAFQQAATGPKNPKDWDSTVEFVDQQLQSLNAPAPAGMGQMPSLSGIPQPGSQLVPAGGGGRY